jgi:hypothetical protein
LNYVLQVAPLAPALQLSPVQISQGTLFASEPLQLSLALGPVTMRRNRACVAGPVALALTLPETRIGKPAQTMTVTPLQIRPRLSKATLTYTPYFEIPQIFPSAREFIPPALDITEVSTQAGTVVQRIWASQPGGGSLRLGFVNIPDADAEKLAKIWDRAKGKRLKLALPTRFFEGEDPALLEHLELKGQPLMWGFREKPTVRSVIPGISSIDLEFKGRGYGGAAIPLVTTPDPPRLMPIDPLPLLLEISPAGLRYKRLINASPLTLAMGLSPVNIGLTGPLRTATTRPLALAVNTPGVNLSLGSVSILLPMTGSNGSTVFTDTSRNAFAVSRFGNAQISTAQSKWGGGSGLFDGNGDYLSIPYAAALDLLGFNCTVEAWIRLASNPTASGMRIAAAGGGAATWNSGNGIHWMLQALSSRAINVQIRIATGTFSLSTPGVCTLNTWHHVAFSVKGSTVYTALDGTVNSATITGLSRPSTNPTTTIGTVLGENGASSTAFNGNIDDFRTTKAAALYMAGYDVPSGPLPAQL